MIALLDQDGDGKVTVNDAATHWKRAVDVLSFGVPGGTGFSMGMAWGMGGGVKKVLAGGAALTIGSLLGTTHLFASSDGFRATVESAAPTLGEELRRRVLNGGGGSAGRAPGGMAGDALWRWSLRAAEGDAQQLRAGEGGGCFVYNSRSWSSSSTTLQFGHSKRLLLLYCQTASYTLTLTLCSTCRRPDER